MKNWELHKSLHARGLNQTRLARLAHTGRSHVSEVLNNKPGHGGQTRKKLAQFLTESELALLGWDKEGNVVPHGTLSQLTEEQKANVAIEDCDGDSLD